METERRSHTATGRALGIGAGVYLLGFGAMASLSRWSSHPRNLPDLYSYRSATWGDGLLLPLSAGALVLASELLTVSPFERKTVWVASILGASVGTLTQVLWLADPNPRTNWTLPAAHEFNTAGWYHAAFLIVACGGFAGLWVRLGLRLVLTEHVPKAARVSAGVAALATAGFLGLVVSDNAPALGTSAAGATTKAIAGAVTAFGLCAAGVFAMRRWLRK